MKAVSVSFITWRRLQSLVVDVVSFTVPKINLEDLYIDIYPWLT
jgi:hypothetical protein